MDEIQFRRGADECLASVEQWLDEIDSDQLDYEVGDGMVTLEFADGERCVLSRQSAARQMWLAAGARGWHFSFDAGSERWLDDKDGGDLFLRLAELVAEKIGEEVEPPGG
jgi:CyaY protein